jgi:hypothetical protein
MQQSAGAACRLCAVAREARARLAPAARRAEMLQPGGGCDGDARPPAAVGPLVAVAARHPVAAYHALVLPCEHVEQALLRDRAWLRSVEGRALVMQMAERGRGLLSRARDVKVKEPGRLVFHLPPFNSQAHLHLHVLTGAFSNPYRDWAHRAGTPWAASPEELLET